MNARILPQIIYPIGDSIPQGKCLCASVGNHGFDYFFELLDLDIPPLEVEVEDEAPTLKDEEVQALGHIESWD